jgi:glutathionyl-hydroquinone reductase
VKPFDAAYPGLVMCNLHPHRRSRECERLLARLIAIPALRDAFNLDHTKRGYYSIHAFNLTRPLGPELAGTTRRG